MSKKQKFQIGEVVKIAEDLGDEGMDHFPKNIYAIVEYTYAQKYGGSDYNLILYIQRKKKMSGTQYLGMRSIN